MGKTSSILVETSNGIRTILFNKPEKRNALSHEMYKSIADILNESSSNEEIHMIVFTGKGAFFSSGNDVTGWMTSGISSLEDSTILFKNFVEALIKCPKLLVAIVNGPAIGIGATMLGLCDMVYASEKAYFLTPFSKLGICAEACSSYIFPRMMGSKAGDMLYLGYKMNAVEAKHYGLVSEIYKEGCVDDIWKYLNKISALSVHSIRATKGLVRKWNQEILLEVNNAEVRKLQERLQSSDILERIMMLAASKNRSKLLFINCTKMKVSMFNGNHKKIMGFLPLIVAMEMISFICNDHCQNPTVNDTWDKILVHKNIPSN